MISSIISLVKRRRRSIRRPWLYYYDKLSQFEKDVVLTIAQQIEDGKPNPTIKEFLVENGFDPNALDVTREVKSAFSKHKKICIGAWKDFKNSPDYEKLRTQYLEDEAGFYIWRDTEDNTKIVYELTKIYKMPLYDVKKWWVHSKLWDEFITRIKSNNLYFFISRSHQKNGVTLCLIIGECNNIN